MFANPRAKKLRELIARPGMIDAIGSHDVLSARQIEQAGFEVVYVGGSAVASVDHGIPDMGLITPMELVEHARRITSVVQIPLIADLDDGGGNPIRVRRAVRLAEQVGVAGFHIEDTDFSIGKHFVNHDQSGMDLDSSRMRPPEEFVQCIRAAVEARSDENTVVIARSDAARLSSLDDAIDRARSYADAGADMVFLWAVEPEDVAKVVQAIPVPLMYLAHDVTKQEKQQLERDGVKLLFRPSVTREAAFGAVSRMLRELKNDGQLQGFERAPFKDRAESVDGHEWTEYARSYGMIP